MCLLERGRELHPGEYPRSTKAATEHLQLDPAGGQLGDRRSLYAFHVGEDVSVFSGCGLGGTSLVNANVALGPEPWVLDDDRWPLALRNDRAGLDRGFQAAESMLRPVPYPDDFPPLAKIAALQRTAAGASCYCPPINVTFRSAPKRVAAVAVTLGGATAGRSRPPTRVDRPAVGWEEPSVGAGDRPDRRVGWSGYLNQMRWYPRLSGCSSSATSAASKMRFRMRGKFRTSVPPTAMRPPTWSTAATTATP